MLEFIKITQELAGHTFSLLSPLSFKGGSVIRVTGPNGCGKTTLLELMAHLQRGEVEMCFQDHDVKFRDPLYCQKINFISLHDPLPDFMSVSSYLEYQQLSADDPLIKSMDLTQNIAKLSTGMRQRLRLLQLREDASIHYVDEPYNGLDSQYCQLVDQIFTTKAKKGQLVIYASHIAGHCDQELDCETIVSIS